MKPAGTTELGASGRMQIILLVFLWVLLLGQIYGYWTGELEPRIVFTYAVVILGLTVWNRTVRLAADDSGVSYRSGFRTKRMPWSEIRSLTSTFQFDGSRGDRTFTIYSAHDSKYSISFNMNYFRSDELAEFVRHILSRNPDIGMDSSVSDFLKEYSDT